MSIVGLVVIGRNEGDRLKQCLRSARSGGANHLVYVDSNSTDGSAEWARSFGADVVDLDMTQAFTAARARNAGVRRLLEVAPDTQFIQFIDGDCELQPQWIAAGAAALEARPKVAAVCGRLRERYPDATIYNRLCDMEWDIPIGEIVTCGGVALIRRTAFEQVGGFCETMIAGEEPDMCFRMRAAGWIILRIDAEMGLHDAAITRFGQWWKRQIRNGHAYAEGHYRNSAPPEHFWRRNVLSNFFWAAFFPFLPLLYLKLLVRYRNELLARFIALTKIPQAIGQLKFYWTRWRGRHTGLIEYK